MIFRIISIFVSMAILPLMGFGQGNYKVHFGATGTFSAKLSIFDQDGKTTEHYKPMAATQAAATLYIEDPNALSLFVKLGLCYDVDDYLVNNNNGLQVGTDQLNLIFNPEVLFPLANQKFKLGFGIGMEYLLGKNLSLNGEGGTNINNAYYYGNMDQKQRNLVPFLNADCWYECSSKIWVGFGVKQPLLSSYYHNETIDFAGTNFNLKHQPTYFSASVFYQFF